MLSNNPKIRKVITSVKILVAAILIAISIYCLKEDKKMLWPSWK